MASRPVKLSMKTAPSKNAASSSNASLASHDIARINMSPAPAPVPSNEAELLKTCMADITTIKTSFTCSICDQLLYEPWTLSCGHIYCYSCLCNWFVPNKRKKTCPECRTVIKQLPAPSLKIKQIVEDIFIKRTEWMSEDETIEQHEKKRLEETTIVEKDRSGDNLFKGTFPARTTDPWLDEEDGVMRCPTCGHEYEGGSSCFNCEQEFNEDSDGYGLGFSDVDDDDVEIDLNDLDEALFEPQRRRFTYGSVSDMVSDGSSEDEHSNGSESMSNHSAQHEEPAGSPIVEITDDDSDEGGAPSMRRPRRRRIARDRLPTVLQILDETDASDSGDHNEDCLRHAGWNPLNQEDESDNDGLARYADQSDCSTSENDYYTDPGSDTETMIGRRALGEDQTLPPSSRSQTPLENLDYGSTPCSYNTDYGGEDASDVGSSGIMDPDGDTDMETSPNSSRSGRSLSVVSNNQRYGPAYGQSNQINGIDLGYAHNLHGVEDDPSSDDTEVDPRRRSGRNPTRRYGESAPIYGPYRRSSHTRHIGLPFSTASADFNIFIDDILGHTGRQSAQLQNSQSRSRPRTRTQYSPDDVRRMEAAVGSERHRFTYGSYRTRRYNDRRRYPRSPSANRAATGVNGTLVGGANEVTAYEDIIVRPTVTTRSNRPPRQDVVVRNVNRGLSQLDHAGEPAESVDFPIV